MKSVIHFKQKKKYGAHFIFSILALILAVLTGISSTKILIETSRCSFILIAGPSLYVTFKTLLYLTLIGRLWVLFTGSFKQIYNKKALQLYSLFFVAFNITLLILTYFRIKFVYSTDNGYPYCLVVVPDPDWGVISLTVLDFVVGSINIVLFSKPLCKMYAVHGRVYYKIVVIRACIASILAHLTTFAALIGIFLGAPLEFVISSDLITSSICVIALYRWNWYCTNWMIPNWKEYKKHSGRTTGRRRPPKSEDDNVAGLDEKAKKNSSATSKKSSLTKQAT